MKRLLVTIALIGFCTANSAAYAYIQKDQQVYFNPINTTWSEVKQTPMDVMIINKGPVGSDKLNEYRFENGARAIPSVTNAEYIKSGALIGINSEEMKFCRYVYSLGRVEVFPLSDKIVSQLYPDYEIVKISQFNKYHKHTVYKKRFTKKKLLIINDTDKSFAAYSYQPKSFVSPDMKNFLTAKRAGQITISVDRKETKETPKYRLYVKNR